MINARKISDCGRNYHLPLSRRWCVRVGLAARSRLLIHGEIDGRLNTWEVRIVAHGRGLHFSVPRAWRRWWRLTYGSWVVVLLQPGGELELQPLPGASLKELEIRGLHEALDEVERAENRLEATYRAGYAQGLATGYSMGFGAGLRNADGLPPKGKLLD